MTILVNKNQFIPYFLDPISKITERCVINISPKGLTCVGSTEDDTIILIAGLFIKTGLEDDEKIKLNIGNVKKIINVLKQVEEDEIELDVSDSVLKYKSDKVKFRMHLLDNGIIESPNINVSKLNQLPFGTDFTLSKEAVDNVLKGSLFSTDSNKIYLYTRDKQIYGELADKKIQNIDTIEYKIAETYNGDDFTGDMPIDMEIFRILKGLKFESIHVKASNQPKVLLMEISNDKSILKYILPTMTE